MEWDANGFIETKKEGFISAVHRYGNVAVAFRDGKIYTHVLDDGGFISFEDMVASIKSAYKSNDSDYPYFYDDYVELFDGEEFSNTEAVGLQEYEDDMLKRIKDLSGYWYVEETETL